MRQQARLLLSEAGKTDADAVEGRSAAQGTPRFAARLGRPSQRLSGGSIPLDDLTPVP